MNLNNSSSRNFTLGIRGGGAPPGGGGVGGGVGGTLNLSSPTSSGSHHHHYPSIKYVYDLPYLERKEICRIFDENNLWETLGGGLMGYSSSELSEFGRVFLRGSSPTDALLTSWASQNHTILELFTLFGRLSHFRAMKVVARFVDPKYHVYIRDPEVNATQELIQLESPLPPPGLLAPPLEHKVQNNINFLHPDSPKKLSDPKEAVQDANALVKNSPSSSTSSSSQGFGHLPQIPYQELLTATSNWERRNILGKGGFGTVYKGLWKNTAVAIKRMEQRANHAYVESQMKQSLGELRCLNSCRHDNILPLYGFSLEGEHPCLVYQFMVNGSLEDRLLCRQKTPPLQWLTRYHIARGVACGIQFLHGIGSKPLIHGDIKSANILLDRNYEAKIGDFGLAREMPGSDKSYVKVSRVHGTRPYLPDEYLRSKKLSTKVDTFSFGIMLFEIGTGQRAYEESRHKKFLREVVEEAEGNYEPLRDQKGGGENPDIFWHFLKVGRSCTERVAKNRPEMVQVLKAFDLFFSQQNTQASSIRTVSSQVTGIPLLFETRPASLLIPGGGVTAGSSRLSPEMRAPSPYWMPQQGPVQNQQNLQQGNQSQGGGSGGGGGYQTPPTMSTNQSVHQQQQQQIRSGGGGGFGEGIRRSPLPSSSPSPSTVNYPIPQMTGMATIAPGMYQQNPNPFQVQYNQQQPHQQPPMMIETGGGAPSPFVNIGGGGGGGIVYNPYHPQISPRVRNLSQQSDTVAPPFEGSLQRSNQPQVQLPPSPLLVASHPVPTSGGTPQSQNSSNSTNEKGGKPDNNMDDFFPVFLLEKEEADKKKLKDSIQLGGGLGQEAVLGGGGVGAAGGAGEGAETDEDEDHNDEWTNEQDGPATVIPLITELGIKDQNQQDS